MWTATYGRDPSAATKRGSLGSMKSTKLKYDFTLKPSLKEIPKIIGTVIERAGLNQTEAYDTFNMGVGLVIGTSNPKKILNFSHDFGYKAWEIGKVIQ